MKYGHILSYVASTLWAIEPAKMGEILSVLAFRAAGHEFTPAEIQARIGEPLPPTSSKHGAIAILPLRGVIAHRMGSMDESSGGMSAERFTAMVQTAQADASIGTVIIDCDSPGGTVPGVPEAADAVFALRETKRVVAVANSQMCSAAYWICSQAHEIVGLPSALENKIGSIGAFFAHKDLSAALEKEGIKFTLISAGTHKVDGNPFEPPSAEYLADLKALADDTHRQFLKAVARGRGVTPAAVRSGYGEGQMLPSVAAKAAGMIDRIATMDETIARLVGRSPRAVGMRTEGDEVPLLAGDVPAEDSALVAAALADVRAEFDRRRRLERF